jgi:diadenosine tetraphosphatase ApaH/serine/threonine PP2A family protein phosphatase
LPYRPPCIQNIVSSTKAAESKINKLSNKENYWEHPINFYDFKLIIEWLMKSLPVVEDTIFCMHGGLSPDLKEMSQVSSHILYWIYM